MKIACVAVVKDEERYIAEWIAYQIALGFDTVVLLDNDSADQTKAVAAKFAPRYDVRVFDWPKRTSHYQLQAYETAARWFAEEFAWMAFFDTDEFLVLDEAASLKQCLSGLPDAAAVAVSWAIFGSSGHRESPAGLVIENYLHRATADFGPNRHVKSIIRPRKRVRELTLAPSTPHAFEMDGAYVDLAGRPIEWDFLGQLSGAPDYAGGKLHHYFTRSWSDWQAKLRRGYHDAKRAEADFYVFDQNDIFDGSAAKLAPLVKTIMSGITEVETKPVAPLVICPKIHGGTKLILNDPECRTYRNVLHMPFRHEMPSVNRSHGIYDLEGRLITAAGRFFGPDSARVDHSPLLFTAQNRDEVKARYDDPLFYLGRFTNHYGHFLVDTLCRMWAFKSVRQPNMKILYHGDHGAESFFEMEFAAAIFRSMGLTQADFIKFDEQTILGDIVIASPCFEELHFVHKVFTEFFNQAGASIAGAGAASVDDTPVYLTKMNVKSGISHFVNEAEFVNVLAKAGVEIIAPETLAFRDQIDIFRNRKVVTGLIGSAFHTSIFVPERKMLVLNYEDTVWSNQLLMDRANGNDVTYVYEGRNSENLGNDGKFLNNFVMADPKHLAERFLREIDRVSSAAGPSKSVRGFAMAEKKHKFSIVACARWETPYIVEWLNYNRAIGFDHVFLYCNDDDPAELYARVLPFTEGPSPFVTFNYHAGQGEQLQMYRHFLLNHLHETEWVGFLDIDEFLRLPPDTKIAGFMAGFDPAVDCVLFNWIFFGPNGHKTPPAGAVLANYTRRSESIHPYTKYLVKAALLTGETILDPEAGHGFWHSLHDKLPAPIRVVNVLGEDAKDYYDGFPDQPSSMINRYKKNQILSTAIIHHYAFRSEQAFWERSARGLEGAFKMQTIWRDLAEGDGFAAFLETVNATEDLRLAEYWQALLREGWRRRAVATQFTPASGAGVKLGIAITTLNRCDMLLNLVKKIREFTKMDYALVICDDGSTDATKSALMASGQVVIGGTQHGIAWNKNRGIYYLLHVLKCDVIILLDDDVVPVAPGWEAEWVEAACRYGHVNYALPEIRPSIKAGASTAADPGLSGQITGCALAFSRAALAQIGYLDTRFGRYGNEHTDLSFRAIRAGFGGITVQEDDWKATYFYVIEGGIEVLPSASSRSQADVDITTKLLHEFFNEPIYRHAWTTDEMRDVFLSEIEVAVGESATPLRLKNHFLSWHDYHSASSAPPAEARKNLALRKPALQSSVSEWSRCATPEEDAAGAVNGQRDGRRKFHTALEDNPWWQVDLGGFATIREIHIYNSTDHAAVRFKNFSLSVSIEGEAWIEIGRKEDDAVVGGIGGGAYVWNGPGTAWARFVRITLLGRDYLHLDQVEVYGDPPP